MFVSCKHTGPHVQISGSGGGSSLPKRPLAEARMDSRRSNNNVERIFGKVHGAVRSNSVPCQGSTNIKTLNAMFCRPIEYLKIKLLCLTNLIGIGNMGEDNL